MRPPWQNHEADRGQIIRECLVRFCLCNLSLAEYVELGTAGNADFCRLNHITVAQPVFDKVFSQPFLNLVPGLVSYSMAGSQMLLVDDSQYLSLVVSSQLV